MIKPTVGRSLHFHAGSIEDQKTFGGPGPFACVLAGVVKDDTINVAVFTREGTVVGRTNVPLIQTELRPAGLSHCAWMPFQVGQAPKSLEASVEVNQLRHQIDAMQTQINELMKHVMPVRMVGDFAEYRSQQLPFDGEIKAACAEGFDANGSPVAEDPYQEKK